MITNIIWYHTAIYYMMSITRDRFRPNWVLSGGCKKHSIINMLKRLWWYFRFIIALHCAFHLPPKKKNSKSTAIFKWKLQFLANA